MVDWVNSIIPDHQIINFTTDWLDGIALLLLVSAFCPTIILDQETLERQLPIKLVTLAMETAETELAITSGLRPQQFISKSVDQLQRMVYVTHFMKCQRISRSRMTPSPDSENNIEEASALEKNGLINGQFNQVDAPIGIENTTYDSERIEVESESIPLTAGSTTESEDSFNSEPKFMTRKPSKEAKEREIAIEKEMETDRASRDKRKSNLDDLFAAVEHDFDSFLQQIDNIGDGKNNSIGRTKSSTNEIQKEAVNPSTAQKEEILELDFDFEFSSDTVTSSDVLSRPQSISPDPGFWQESECRVEENVVISEDFDPLQSIIEVNNGGQENNETLVEEEKIVEDVKEVDETIMELNNGGEAVVEVNNESLIEEKILEDVKETIMNESDEDTLSHLEEQELANEIVKSETDEVDIVINDDSAHDSVDSKLQDDQVYDDAKDDQVKYDDTKEFHHHQQDPSADILHEDFIQATPHEMALSQEENTSDQQQIDIEREPINESIVMSQMSTTTSPEPMSEHSSTPPSPSPSASPVPPDLNVNETFQSNLQSEYSPLSTPHHCKVSGRGLYYGILGQSGDFTVDCSQAGRGRLEIIIESPSGDNLEADGEQIKDSVFRVHFAPTEIGTHKISVLFHDTNVPNSPFSCDISDPSACTTVGLEETQCVLGRDEKFQVNTRNAGPGTLQTTFNGSHQPTDFQLTSCIDGTFTYHYTVPKTGEYEVDIKWVGQHIPGSPFKIIAKDDRPNSKACIILDHQPFENIRVREEIKVRVNCQSAGNGELRTLLRSPKGEATCQVTNENDIYTVTTRSSTVGDHLLVLQYGGYDIPDSPVKVHVNDPSLIKLNVKPNVTQTVSINKVFTFHASTEKCGEGHLSAMATTSDAPNRPIDLVIEQDTSEHGYAVFYTPKSLGIHSIQVLYDNKPCLITPISLKVYDVNSIQDIVLTKTLPALGTQHLLNKLLTFQLSAPNRDPADISFSAVGVRTDQTPQLSMVSTIDDAYSLEFRALQPDDYRITVTYKGEHIQGSPFTIPVRSLVKANKVTMYDPVIPLSSSKPIELVFDTSQAGQGSLTASVLNSKKKNMPVYVEQVNDDIYRVAFIPKESSTFMVTVLYSGKHIGGSPFRVLYQEQSKEPSVSIEFQPEMNVKGLMGSAIYGRNSGRQEATVVQYERGKYQISFRPLIPDTFDLHVYWFDTEIDGSPFEIDLLGMENESSDALVDSVPVVVGSNVGMLAATTVGHKTGPVPIKLTPIENCLCNIEFTSPTKDKFDLNVYWNGKILAGMPIVLPLD